MRLAILFMFIFLAGCSFKSDNLGAWKKETSNSFESYTKYYLEGKTRLASVSLKRALDSAKSSADLRPLSKVYLGVCALHVGVLIDDKCDDFLSLDDVLDKNDSSRSYYYMIEKKFRDVRVKSLPKQYRDFVKAVKKSDFKSAKQDIKAMKNISSALIASSLIKEHLNSDDIDFLIQRASLYGYKKAIIRWLKFLKTTSTTKKNRKIDKLLKILN